METADMTMPAHWASAFINRDFSGLNAKEATLVRGLLAEFAAENMTIVGCSDEPHFCKTHDATYLDVLACDCLIYTVLVSPKKEG
jgi:hypothetical protein